VAVALYPAVSHGPYVISPRVAHLDVDCLRGVFGFLRSVASFRLYGDSAAGAGEVEKLGFVATWFRRPYRAATLVAGDRRSIVLICME
jgi:hypothetical protein